MPNTKVKIQFDDGQGGHYSISLDGQVTKEKVAKIMDIYGLLDSGRASDNEFNQADTLYNRILNLVNIKYQFKPFTSYDIQESYEDQYNETIKLAAVSTYLARLSVHGYLNRRKQGRAWVYTTSKNTLQSHLVPNMKLNE